VCLQVGVGIRRKYDVQSAQIREKDRHDEREPIIILSRVQAERREFPYQLYRNPSEQEQISMGQSLREYIEAESITLRIRVSLCIDSFKFEPYHLVNRCVLSWPVLLSRKICSLKEATLES
jgi:hypothetical protein